MTSSKTTVLGIRLDHERRAWIEAEAARQGVSIRAFFESMIDEARTVGPDPGEPAELIARESVLSFERMLDEARSVRQDPVEPAESSAQESVLRVGSEIDDDTAGDVPSETWAAEETDWEPEPLSGASTHSSVASRGFCDDLVSTAAIPGRVLREALELPRALINVAKCPFRRNRAF
jgi:hypothetical protein